MTAAAVRTRLSTASWRPSFATFAFDSGSLTITNVMTFGGAVDMSGGTIDIQGGDGTTSEIDGTFNLTGGTIEIDNPELDLAGSATLSGGFITGNGSLFLTSTGTLTIDPGATISTLTFELGVGSTTTLNTDLDYAAAFLIDNDISDVTLPPPAGGLDIATLNLNGFTLTLDGPSDLNGEIAGPGSVVIDSTASIDTYLALTGAAILEVAIGGQLADNGAFWLGTAVSDAPELLIDQGGEFDFDASGTIYNATGLVDNAGIFDVMSGVDATVDDAVTNTGTIDVADAASLTLSNGSADFGGTVEDSGTLDFAGGTFDLDSALVMAVGAWNVDAATVNLAANLSYGGTFASSGTLDLNQWTLTLSGGASLAGTISGTGSVTITATANVDAALTNDATITLQDHASLTASAAVHGQGTISVDGTSEADFAASVDSGQTINLVAGATVEIGDLASVDAGTQHQDFNATIAGATSQTTILLSDSGLGRYTAIDGYQLSDVGGNTIVTLTDGGATVGSLTLAGLGYTGIEIAPGPIGTTEITVETPCYCPGTLILTDRGEAPIETLRIGDNVVTRSGAARPIKWIGRRSYSGRFILGRSDILPICIKAGALADELPRRDLWISPHHAIFIDGVLIEAKDLVNGISIVQAERVDRVEYLHIELDSHDVIIAEGALSESFIDDDSRQMFHNAHEHAALYPDVPRIAARFCAPRRNEGYEVEAARRRIAERVGLFPAKADRNVALRGFIDAITSRAVCGWAQNIDFPEAPVCLDIVAGRRVVGRVLANRYRADLERAGLGSGRHGFEFAPPGGLNCSAAMIEVRRSHDGAPLNRSVNAAPEVTQPRAARS
jgi:hypothetical protein